MQPVPSASPKLILSVFACLLSVLVLLATVLWKIRHGLHTSSTLGFDFAWMYAAGKCWLARQNPYDSATYAAALRHSVPASIFNAMASEDRTAGCAYPPNALLVLALFALLPWKPALLLWLALSLASVLLIAGLIVQIIVPNWKQENKLFFIAALLQSRLIFSILSLGQSTLIVFACLLLAMQSMRRWQPEGSGVFLMLSTLKFTFTLPILLFMARQRQRKAILVAFIGVLGFLMAGILPCGGVSAITGYRHALHQWISPGRANDTSPVNSAHRLDIVNIDVVLYNAAGNQPAVVAVLHYALFAAVLYALSRMQTPSIQEPLAFWLAWCAWSLAFFLFLYHRSYDAVLLWPAAATLLEYRRLYPQQSRPVNAGIGAIAFLIFLWPISAIYRPIVSLLSHGRVTSLFAPLEVWVVVFLTILILWLRTTLAKENAR